MATASSLSSAIALSPSKQLKSQDNDVSKSHTLPEYSATALERKTVCGYIIESFIGAGSYANVWVAYPSTEEAKKEAQKRERVALKIAIDQMESAGAWGFTFDGRKALNEITALSYFRMDNHPNIVQLLRLSTQCFHQEQRLVLTLPLSQTDLGLFLEDDRLYDTYNSNLPGLIHGIISGLQYIHEKGFMHLDLKPANILVGADAGRDYSTAAIADMGLIRSIYAETHGMYLSVITLWYRDLGLLCGQQRFGQSVDIWSLGIIMAEILFRFLPFRTWKSANEQDMRLALKTLFGVPERVYEALYRVTHNKNTLTSRGATEYEPMLAANCLQSSSSATLTAELKTMRKSKTTRSMRESTLWKWAAKNDYTVAKAIRYRDPALNSALWGIIDQCLQVDPLLRPPSTTIKRAYEDVLQRFRIPIPKPGTVNTSLVIQQPSAALILKVNTLYLTVEQLPTHAPLLAAVIAADTIIMRFKAITILSANELLRVYLAKKTNNSSVEATSARATAALDIAATLYFDRSTFKKNATAVEKQPIEKEEENILRALDWNPWLYLQTVVNNKIFL